MFELTQISVWDFQLGWYQTILHRCSSIFQVHRRVLFNMMLRDAMSRCELLESDKHIKGRRDFTKIWVTLSTAKSRAFERGDKKRCILLWERKRDDLLVENYWPGVHSRNEKGTAFYAPKEPSSNLEKGCAWLNQTDEQRWRCSPKQLLKTEGLILIWNCFRSLLRLGDTLRAKLPRVMGAIKYFLSYSGDPVRPEENS